MTLVLVEPLAPVAVTVTVAGKTGETVGAANMYGAAAPALVPSPRCPNPPVVHIHRRPWESMAVDVSFGAADTETNPVVSPGTWNGVVLKVPLLSPIWLALLYPQHFTAPLCTAHMLKLTDIAVTPLVSPVTCTGVVL